MHRSELACIQGYILVQNVRQNELCDMIFRISDVIQTLATIEEQTITYLTVPHESNFVETFAFGTV